MIRLPDRELPAETAQQLAEWQMEVDSITSYDQRVQAALRLFRQRSRTATFAGVREELARMCSGVVRCGYCEDSRGHHIEHIWPKSWYPELTFVWRNFLFSCAFCNERKNASFAVIREGALHELVRRRGEPRSPPPAGAAAIIDPRREDPLDYLEIDIGNTFVMTPRAGIDEIARLRADYTIELLELNDRQILLEERAIACRNYSLRVGEYAALDPTTPTAIRQHRLAEIGRLHHRMVWEEMKRNPDLVGGLRAQLDAAPELRSI